MNALKQLAAAGLASLAASTAGADQLSKSVMRPTAITSGVVAGNLPGNDGSTSYYVVVELQPGTLLTQRTRPVKARKRSLTAHHRL